MLPRHAQHQAARLSLRATGSRPSTEHQALAPTLNSEKFFRTQVALTATNCFSPALEGTRSACQHTPGVRGHDTPAEPYKAQVTPRRGTGRSESSGHFAGRHVRLPRLFKHMLFATFFSHISFSCLPLRSGRADAFPPSTEAHPGTSVPLLTWNPNTLLSWRTSQTLFPHLHRPVREQMCHYSRGIPIRC